ncbi:MAG: acetate/propionate family kinase [Nannocystaceae bacterium]|nr:acetate/propionate family kinase [bacterium]
MRIATINCGSSSLKADVLDSVTGARFVRLRAERVGTDDATIRWNDAPAVPLPAKGIEHILGDLFTELFERGGSVQAVGHRVVHGGERFVRPTLIDDAVAEAIESLIPLAPLHNPANHAGIVAARAALPSVPHVAVFDTAFHGTLPTRAKHYAIAPDLLPNARRFGFHGTSHGYVARVAATALGAPLESLRLITCHLGSGASVCAVEYGRSVETSMGMTPLEGLVMGTRSGDLDPGLVLELVRQGRDVDAVDTLLNRKSGLAGVSGTSGDMRDIEAKAAKGDERCRLALKLFAHRLRKYIGAYAATMGGVDAIVFTAGIGQNSPGLRHRVAQRLDFLGAHLDEDRNRDAKVDAAAPVFDISGTNARVKLLVVATDEARAIAEHAAAVAQEADAVQAPKTIPIAVSARHIHLTQDAVEALFGPGHTLTPRNELSQPGQFACEETLTVIGPKRSLERVRVLGPTRPKNQIEVSRTDEFWLGVDAPVRRSGDVANSPGVTLEGPAGSLTLSEGLICAARHIHMTPADAEAFGVKNGDLVEVRVDSNGRDLTFGDVLIRVSPKYALEMHVDTDEANAAELSRRDEGLLIPTEGTARLTRLERR